MAPRSGTPFPVAGRLARVAGAVSTVEARRRLGGSGLSGGRRSLRHHDRRLLDDNGFLDDRADGREAIFGEQCRERLQDFREHGVDRVAQARGRLGVANRGLPG